MKDFFEINKDVRLIFEKGQEIVINPSLINIDSKKRLLAELEKIDSFKKQLSQLGSITERVNVGSVQRLSEFYKEKVEHLLLAVGKSDYLNNHIESLMIEFRERYKKLPVVYPGDFIFYEIMFDIINKEGFYVTGNKLKYRLDQHFASIILQLNGIK